MEDKKKTLVLGASPNPARYSYVVTDRLNEQGHEVVAIGLREGFAGSVPIQKIGDPLPDIHTITLYLNPERQKAYYQYILDSKPVRIIFNPGTENPELVQLARDAGIDPVIACNLVMLSLGNY